MAYRMAPVFLSSAMNTPEMLALRQKVIDLFDKKRGVFGLLDLYSVEMIASPMAPPPGSDLIRHRGIFILGMGEDRDNVRAEIVQGLDRDNRFFVFFDARAWANEKIRSFMAELRLSDLHYSRFRNDGDLLSRLEQSLSTHAVQAMTRSQVSAYEDQIVAADSHIKAGRFGDARSTLMRILKLRPQDIPALYRLGFLQDQHLDDPEGAVESFSTCIVLEPDHRRAQFNLAVATSHVVGREREAVGLYDRFLKDAGPSGEPDQGLLVAKAWVFQAETKVRSGDPALLDTVAGDYEKGIARLGELESVPEARYWLRELKGKLERSAEYASQAGKLDVAAAISALEQERVDGLAELEEGEGPFYSVAACRPDGSPNGNAGPRSSSSPWDYEDDEKEEGPFPSPDPPGLDQ